MAIRGLRNIRPVRLKGAWVDIKFSYNVVHADVYGKVTYSSKNGIVVDGFWIPYDNIRTMSSEGRRGIEKFLYGTGYVSKDRKKR